jgi:outer membrane protein assembly factor BamB
MQRVAEPPGETDSASYASPILVRWGEAQQLVNCSKRHAFGVDATSGRLLWTRPLKTRYEVIAVTPVLVGDAVFVTAPNTPDARLYKFMRQGAQFDVSEVWSTKVDTCHGGLVYHPGSLFGSFYSNGKGLACVDPQTGKVRYETTGLAKGSVLFADDRLYYLSEEGDMVLLEPSGTEFKTVGRFRLVQERKNDVWPHPVILNGRLYLRYHDTLYCYDIRQN